MASTYFRMVLISLRFQGTPSSKREPETSAPYTGALFFNERQNYQRTKNVNYQSEKVMKKKARG